MSRTSKVELVVFLIVLSFTLVVWSLRGFGVLTFLPGGVIWLLLLLTVGTGVFAAVQGTRR